jgi:hypothetical protein
MRKLFVLFVVLVLAACAAPAAPTEQAVIAPPEPTQTPVVVVQTVVVEPTQVPVEPTAVQPVVVTVVVEPTQAPAVAAPTEVPATTDGSAAPIALDNVLGAGVFINMTMSGNAFTFRCFPRDVTFNITANNAAIEDAVLFYRIVDRPDALYPSAWQGPVPMVDNGGGNFSIVFSGEDVSENLRLDEAWFDFQFVGLNKGGGVVDRTQKIERLITFAKDCE